MAGRRAQTLKPSARAELPAAREIDLGWLGGTVGFYLRTAQEVAFQAFARKAIGTVGLASEGLKRRFLRRAQVEADRAAEPAEVDFSRGRQFGSR